jgi:sodium-coupled neutral amino acid transporter 11
MLTDCLGIVLELNGVLAAVPLAYIIPAVTYLKLDPGRLWTPEKIPAFLLAATGLLVAICGTILTLVDVLNGISCSHGVEMPYCRDADSYGFLNKTTTPAPSASSSSLLDFKGPSSSSIGFNFSNPRLQ